MNKITLYMETTTKEPEITAGEIQKLLKKYKLKKFMFDYDDNGEISGVIFGLEKEGIQIPFKLPINHIPLWEMSKQGKTRYIRDEHQARRVAWRQTYRWLQAQLALVDTHMVEIEEIFLPYILIDKKGTTVYQKFANDGLNKLIPGSVE